MKYLPTVLATGLSLGFPVSLAASDIAQEGSFLPLPSRPPELHADESLPLQEHAQGWYASGMLYVGGDERVDGGTVVERDADEPLDAQLWLHLLRAVHGHDPRHWPGTGASRTGAYIRIGSDPRAAGHELDVALGASATSHGFLPGSAWLELGQSSAERGGHLLARVQLCVFEAGVDVDEEQTTWTYGLGLRWPGGAVATTPGTAPWMLHGGLHALRSASDGRDVEGLGLQLDAGVRLGDHLLLQAQVRWASDALTGRGEDDIVQAQLGVGASF